MSHFDDVFNNDPDYLKSEQNKLKKLVEEKANYQKQNEIVKMGVPQPRLTMGKFIPNTQKAQEKLEKGYLKKVEEINKQANEYKFKRAKELKHHDPPGYDKWQKKQEIIQRERERIEQLKKMRENQKGFERGR